MIGPEWLRATAEIGSDAFAFASAGAVIVPVFKTIRLRKRLAELNSRIRQLGADKQEAIQPLLSEQALRLSEFDPLEERSIWVGIWCLAMAVLLRVAFHMLAKLELKAVHTAALDLVSLIAS